MILSLNLTHTQVLVHMMLSIADNHPICAIQYCDICGYVDNGGRPQIWQLGIDNQMVPTSSQALANGKFLIQINTRHKK